VTTEDVTAVTLPNVSAKERNRHNSRLTTNTAMSWGIS